LCADQVGDVRDEVLADALDHPGAGLDADRRSRPVGQDRADRIGQHHLGLGRDRLAKKRPRPVSVPPEPTPTTTASTSPHLLQDLRAGAGLVRQRVGRVVELVDVERAPVDSARWLAMSW
jgi:hypothetical protein